MLSIRFLHSQDMEWGHMPMDCDKLSCKFIQSTCNLHSNYLRRWIGSICIQFKSIQCAFRVDTINLNQCALFLLHKQALSAHYIYYIAQIFILRTIMNGVTSDCQLIIIVTLQKNHKGDTK